MGKSRKHGEGTGCLCLALVLCLVLHLRCGALSVQLLLHEFHSTQNTPSHISLSKPNPPLSIVKTLINMNPSNDFYFDVSIPVSGFISSRALTSSRITASSPSFTHSLFFFALVNVSTVSLFKRVRRMSLYKSASQKVQPCFLFAQLGFSLNPQPHRRHSHTMHTKHTILHHHRHQTQVSLTVCLRHILQPPIPESVGVHRPLL